MFLGVDAEQEKRVGLVNASHEICSKPLERKCRCDAVASSRGRGWGREPKLAPELAPDRKKRDGISGDHHHMSSAQFCEKRDRKWRAVIA